MSHDGPPASWHPAMRPNSIADLPKFEPAVPSSLLEQPTTDAHKYEALTEAHSKREETSDGVNALDARDPGDEATGEQWPGEEITTEARPECEPVKTEAATESDDNTSPNSTNTASKHQSTLSFTRTVSHEVNFNDDEEVDAEFELTRPGIDPFKFMPPNDRTNSFPVVPPVEQQRGQALPPNQAEYIIQQVEQDQNQDDSEDLFAQAAQDATEDGFLEDDVQEAAHQFMGGEVHGANEEASEARFDEGIPLIPHESENNDNGVEAAPTKDPFGGDEGDEDDFFTQVRGSDASNFRESLEGPKPGIQRISTLQVLNGMGVDAAPSSFASVEEIEEKDASGFAMEQAASATKAETGEDIDAKWKAIFAGDDDDDFLLEDDGAPQAADPEGFLGSDDEGLLDDTEDLTSLRQAQQASELAPTQSPGMNGQYIPQGQAANYASNASNASSPYAPAASLARSQPLAATPYSVPQAAPNASPYGYGAPPPRVEPNRAQSFVDKAKGGYTSPYDLPMDVVQPRKRMSMQNLQRSTHALGGPPSGSPMPQGPPRSASMHTQGSPPPTNSNPPALVHSTSAPPVTSKQVTAPKKEKFFEELPVTAKPRPGSRQSNKSLPSPSQISPYGPPKTSSPPPMAPSAQGLPLAAQPPLNDISKLVAPERVGPYASLSNTPPAPSVPTSNRYSPAPPPAPNGAVPAALSNRYSPAPGGVRPPSGGYSPSSMNGPPVLPHLPRTSSPLAHFEISHGKTQAPNHGEVGLGERRSNSALHESRLQRVPSLPPTSEVDEEDAAPGLPNHITPMAPPSQRYAQIPSRARQTPPPPAHSAQSTLSPPKRSTSGYGHISTSQEFVPPPRSQTQSPGALYGDRRRSIDPVPRPSSVHSPTSPQAGGYGPATISQVAQSPPAPMPPSVQPTLAPRTRSFSQNFSLIPPTDGRENDPLQRWRGSPLFSWGVGGTMVTMFPKDVPRYGINKNVPTVMRSPGEVKIKNMKDTQPLEERLSKFPGPLKGKSKKKEIIAWLSTGIEDLERLLPPTTFQAPQSHDDKRTAERVLLWKIMRLLIEFDGALDGNPAVEKAVRDVLSPNPNEASLSPVYATGASIAELSSASPSKTQADAVDSSTVEQLRTHLLAGDREKAVWAAVDKRLWGHAMLIANTVSPDLYKRVAQEFVKKEVNFPGHNNESLAALYEVLSGNHEESVDELVPVHARAGLQLIGKDSVGGTSGDAMAGLDKWRETLGLILSNRSVEDAKAINALGNLLSGYGRAEAAHICFLFARNHTLFGGLDDPNSNFVLVGSDHKRQVEQFAKESEPLLLSEVYEYGLSLTGGSNVTITSPHLAGYKFQHALTLAEYGSRDKALQYCEAIYSAITAQTRRSPYYHHVLEAGVEDLMKRLKQAPKEESNSWIPKPSMNKVSDSVWNRFNKFVAGEDNEGSGQGTGVEGDESGPFARLAGGTPTISRPPSSSNFETFGASIPGYPIATNSLPAGAPLASSRTSSRYAPAQGQPLASANPYDPVSAYVPKAPSEQGSSEINRGSFEMSRQSAEFQPASYGNPYAPQGQSVLNQGYQPPAETGYAPQQGYQPSLPVSQPNDQPPTANLTSGYEPLGHASAPINGAGYQPAAPFSAAQDSTSTSHNEASAPSDYQTPSYGYEPTSFTPYEAGPGAQSSEEAPAEATNGGSYEPPSFQSYEPPSYEPYNPPSDDNGTSDLDNSKKRGVMYDDEDDFGAPKPREKSKSDKDRENNEMFRKIAEQEAKAEAEKKAAAGKKGWGFGGWFGGGPKKEAPAPEPSGGANPNKPIRAKLGEANSFYFDPELKRWVNKNAGPEDNVKKATPPPPKGLGSGPRSATSTPPPFAPTSNPDMGRASAPPAGPPRTLTPLSQMSGPPGPGTAPPGGAPSMMRTASGTSAASGPPSRPATALSTTSSIDDLLGPAGARPKGLKKSRKSGRYVDVMAKQ